MTINYSELLTELDKHRTQPHLKPPLTDEQKILLVSARESTQVVSWPSLVKIWNDRYGITVTDKFLKSRYVKLKANPQEFQRIQRLIADNS